MLLAMKSKLMLLSLFLAAGCAVQKNITIIPKPADALVRVNGADIGRGTVEHKFTFDQPEDIFYVTAVRKGFQDKTVNITRDYPSETLSLEMKPYTRRISITTTPVPAIISVDGRPLTAEPSSAISTDVEFTVDASDNWITHTVTAERKGFIKSEQQVTWTDSQPLYNLKLDPMHKDLRITTNPPGAHVFLDNQDLGVAPLTDRQVNFDFDTNANAWVDKTLRVEKPGYDPIERKISWDNGNSDYEIDLIPKTKTIRLTTDPADAVVTIDGVQTRRDGDANVADLVFTPNEAGQLRTFKVHASKKTADAAWYPADMTIAWDGGKPDYTLKLREVLSQATDSTQLQMKRDDGDWKMVAVSVPTTSMKFVTEPDGDQPTKIVQLSKGQTIGSLSVSPDGQYLVYTVVGGTEKEPTSVMYRVRADGTGGPTAISDGRSLDVTPSYTAAGDKIVYASNRASKKLNIWAISPIGEGGISRYTAGDSNDLYPSVDASAKPRLFFEAHIDVDPKPRLYTVQVGATLPTDLTLLGGSEPRISPRNDAVIYTLVNDKTGNHDLYRVSDKGGGLTESLTSDSDNIDPSFDSSGAKVAFSSNRGKEAEDGRLNYDIWVLDLANPANLKQVTKNGSVDDSPAFDPTGDSIYFRSNRGGVWGIWKIAVK